MSLGETQSARADFINFLQQQCSSYSGHTLWHDLTFIWQPYLERSFLPKFGLLGLSFCFSSNWNFATILLHFFYIFLILDSFSGFWNCPLNSKMADPKGGHIQICDVIVAFCDVMTDTRLSGLDALLWTNTFGDALVW